MRNVLSLLFVSGVLWGCASDEGKRIAYNALQGASEQACLRNSPDKTSTECLKRQSYDEYQRQRGGIDSPESAPKSE